MITPTDQQKAAVEVLQTASATAVAHINATCPSQAPATMMERFDMIVKRIDALSGATAKVKPTLSDFYNTLGDEQKARFKVIGRSGRASAPR